MSPQAIRLRACPRIVRAGRTAEIVIEAPPGEKRFLAAAPYSVRCVPMEGKRPGGGGAGDLPAARTENGKLIIRHDWPGEQEYALAVEESAGGTPRPLGEARVYAADDDLFSLLPWKGDFHLHTLGSDGREPPPQAAAACRRIGMDFMAVTDHRTYAPSREAIEAFRGVPINLRINPGEEIHPPDCRIHIINFGGRASINEMFTARAGEYAAEIGALAAGLPAGTLSEAERREYAACVWCYRQIRDAGGLAIFCHPYWVTKHAYNVPEALIRRHFDDMPCDALELIGGYYRHEAESNMLQVVRYYTELGLGRRIPIVGASDAHGCERGDLFGWYYTIVFGPSPGLADVAAAVRDCRAVAVEALPGAPVRVYGPFRLVKYALFLFREVFPDHDALCEAEGQAMARHAAGDPDARHELARLHGRAPAAMARMRGE